MIIYLKEHLQLFVLMILWTITGIYLGSVSFAIIGLSIVLLMTRRFYVEILLGFWMILMYSDSFEQMFDFAKAFKPIYMLVVAGVVILHRHVLLEGQNVIFRLFLPFFVWSFLIMYDNPQISLSFQKTLSYSLLFFTVPAIMRHLLERDQHSTLKAIVFFGTAYLTAGLILRFFGVEFVYHVGRFSGLMGNPNGLGVLTFLFAMLFATASFRHPNFLPRGIRVLVWLIIFANLFMCQSRSALFATLLYLLFSSASVLRGFVGIIAFAIIIFSYQFLLHNLPLVVTSLGLEEFFRLDTLEGGSGRLIAWEFTWTQIQDNFFVGRGFTYTDWIFWQNYDLLTSLGHLGNAHNSFLTFWLDTGLIGLILYLIAFFLMFFTISKRYANAVPVMYAIIFSASFESWLTASLNPNTITLLMTLSIMLYGRPPEDKSSTIDGSVSDEGEENPLLIDG